MKKIATIFLLGIWFVTGKAQNPDFKAEYDAFRNQARKDYNDFRDAANAEYTKFMSEAWKLYQSMPEIPVPKEEDVKPPVIIPRGEIEKIPESKPVPYKEVIPPPPVVIQEQPKPVAPVPVAPPVANEKQFNFTAFGTNCKVRLSNENKFSLTDCKEGTVAKAWQRLSQPEYNNLLRDCLDLRNSLNLCDWAYLEMLEQLSASFCGKGSNEATLLTAFLYNQSGYKMRLARSETNRLYFLVASRHVIYKMQYYTIAGDKFYVMDSNDKGLYIFDRAFPNEQSLSLTVGKEQYFAMDPTAKKTLTSERYPQVTAAIASNRNLINFFDTYPKSHINNDPTTVWTFYANTPLSQSVKDILYPVLKNAIQGKSEQDAANILINFVQTAFEYKTDDEIWGGSGIDRPLFADETIYYPYSNCKDRAILFSRLVRDLMGLKVVFLFYPGHLATAVQFHESIPGDYLIVNGVRYLVCDPTYIRANIGRTMPGMDNSTASVVFLE